MFRVWQHLLRQWSYHKSFIFRSKWNIADRRLQVLKYYALLIMGRGMLPFGRVHCADNDNTESRKRIPRNSDLDFIDRFLMRLRSWLLRSFGFKEEKLQLQEVNRSMMRPQHYRETFRIVTISEYENRLRKYSRPMKVFRYFASIQTKNEAGQTEILMTPVDFVRSMLPGFRQPENLGLNQFRKVPRENLKNLSLKYVTKDSIFYKLRPDGLLSYSDYLYLLMLVPLTDRYFEIGFNLFDQQGNGSLRKSDMNQLLLGLTEGEQFQCASSVNNYFFGPKNEHKLNLGKFLEFKRHLIKDILLIEFNLLCSFEKPNRDKNHKDIISQRAFALLLLSYANLPRSQKIAARHRIKAKYKKFKRGITFDEFLAFSKFLRKLPIIDMALTYHFLAGADISRSTMKHISDVVVGVTLSPRVIDIIFTVFDTDNNGILGRDEFIEAMQHRRAHGKKKSVKLSKIYNAVWRCAHQTMLVS